MTDILDQIDAAIGCQQCGRSLAASVSDDFCSEDCQYAWYQSRVAVSQEFSPIEYRDPDLERARAANRRHLSDRADSLLYAWGGINELRQRMGLSPLYENQLLESRYHTEVPEVTQLDGYRMARCTRCGQRQYRVDVDSDPVSSMHHCIDENWRPRTIVWLGW